MSISKIGKKHSEAAKKKMRISRVDYIKKNGAPTIGKNEKQILDEIELSNNIKIERQYSVCGYLLDGYCRELKIAFEVDEKFHLNNKQKIKDKIRQNNIVNELNCDFIRIKDDLHKSKDAMELYKK